AAEIEGERRALQMPGMQARAVARLDENAFGPLRGQGALAFRHALRLENQTLLQKVKRQRQREPDRGHDLEKTPVHRRLRTRRGWSPVRPPRESERACRPSTASTRCRGATDRPRRARRW